jgi:hypothetical protein
MGDFVLVAGFYQPLTDLENRSQPVRRLRCSAFGCFQALLHVDRLGSSDMS